MIVYRIAHMVLLVIVAAGLAGCGTETAPPVAPKRLAPKPPPAPVTPAVDADEAYAEIAEEVVNSYVAAGKRDPFRSFRFEKAEPVVAVGPLADFDLSQLSIVGLVWNTTNPRALVSDPGGRSFVLQEGSHIGKNRGRVIRIDQDLILVQEEFVDFDGAVSTKDVEMRIRKSQGG